MVRHSEKCIFCGTLSVKRFLFYNQWTCKECIDTSYRLLFEEKFDPKSLIEHAVLSFIFFLEVDLKLTRYNLNSGVNLEQVQESIQKKELIISKLNISYDGVSDELINKVNDLVSEHKLLLSLFIPISS